MVYGLWGEDKNCKMKKDQYLDLKKSLIQNGYANEIDWQENVKPCDQVATFANEAIWVILNSGMKEQIARKIWSSIKSAWAHGKPTSFAFKHAGKVAAIDYINQNAEMLFDEYLASTNPVDYLQTIPFIGSITKWHLAKNLGHDVVKPDRHLVRIAGNYGFENCNNLCQYLSNKTGDKVSVVDIVLWRSANLGWI